MFCSFNLFPGTGFDPFQRWLVSKINTLINKSDNQSRTIAAIAHFTERMEERMAEETQLPVVLPMSTITDWDIMESDLQDSKVARDLVH
jgi:hypothetical protein